LLDLNSDVDYHQNLIVSSLVHVPPFHQILRTSVGLFSHNPANEQTNKTKWQM